MYDKISCDHLDAGYDNRYHSDSVTNSRSPVPDFCWNSPYLTDAKDWGVDADRWTDSHWNNLIL